MLCICDRSTPDLNKDDDELNSSNRWDIGSEREQVNIPVAFPYVHRKMGSYVYVEVQRLYVILD